MRSATTRQAALAAAALTLLAAAAPSASAEERARKSSVPLLPLYQEECGSCHVAYPPGLLPAASWQRLMDNLPHHFGTDASLDGAAGSTLSGWLAANAGASRRGREEPPQDRITRSDWFVRKHREVPAGAWQRAAVKSPANCAAFAPRSFKI